MNPFLGEIRPFGFTFAPTGWAECNGQLLPISQNTALFSLLGTQYGGDGKSNFALPNLQSQVVVGAGQGPGLNQYDVGDEGGSDSVTLTIADFPGHNHVPVAVAAAGTTASPVQTAWAEPHAARGQLPSYSATTTSPQAVAPGALGPAGSGSPHENRPPLLVVTFCIAMQGVFPARN